MFSHMRDIITIEIMFWLLSKRNWNSGSNCRKCSQFFLPLIIGFTSVGSRHFDSDFTSRAQPFCGGKVLPHRWPLLRLSRLSSASWQDHDTSKHAWLLMEIRERQTRRERERARGAEIVYIYLQLITSLHIYINLDDKCASSSQWTIQSSPVSSYHSIPFRNLSRLQAFLLLFLLARRDPHHYHGNPSNRPAFPRPRHHHLLT